MIGFIRKIYRKYFDTRSPIQFEIDCLKQAICANERELYYDDDPYHDCYDWHKQGILDKLKRQRDRLDYLIGKAKQ